MYARTFLLLPLVLTACGGGGEVSGLYRTTSASINLTGCGPGTSTTTPAFVRVQEGSLFGQTYFTSKGCSTQDEASCGTAGGIIGNGLLSIAEGNGWSGGFDAASGFNGICGLTSQRTFAERSADTLTIEATVRSGEVMTTDCTVEQAKAKAAELPCTGYQRVEGVRIADVPKATGLNLGF